MLTIINAKVALGEFLGPTNLLKVETLNIIKFLEIFIINEDVKFMFAALQVSGPSLKDFNNSQKLLIMDLITSFSKDYFL